MLPYGEPPGGMTCRRSKSCDTVLATIVVNRYEYVMSETNPSTSQRRKFKLDFWIPAIAGSVFLMWYLILPSWRNVYGDSTASSWPQTSGQVFVSGTYMSYTAERIQRKACFRYRYDVGGTQYESDRYSFRFADGDAASAIKVHGEGDTLVVFYDPNSPQHSVINRDANSYWNHVVLIAFAFVAILLAIRFNGLQMIRDALP